MFRHPVVDHCINWLNDVPRNTWYRDRLRVLAPNRSVFEAGCGSGILAAYALESGAKHYYGIDINRQRSEFTAAILDRLGYQGRHTVWCADALTITSRDVSDDIGVVLCEQTGHQMQNNFALKRFYQNLFGLFPNAAFLPDMWSMDVYIYEGCHDSELQEYQPQILLDDSSLPHGYKTAIDSYDFIKAKQHLQNVIQLNPTSASDQLCFELDLRDYGSATVVLTDSISCQGMHCRSSSILYDWSIPVSIVIEKAKGRFNFEWDSNQRRKGFERGFWRWSRVH